jgi:hypothetical protein
MNPITYGFDFDGGVRSIILLVIKSLIVIKFFIKSKKSLLAITVSPKKIIIKNIFGVAGSFFCLKSAVKFLWYEAL